MSRKPKLTPDQAEEARDMYRGTWSISQIARFFKVDAQIIHKVIDRKKPYEAPHGDRRSSSVAHTKAASPICPLEDAGDRAAVTMRDLFARDIRAIRSLMVSWREATEATRRSSGHSS